METLTKQDINNINGDNIFLAFIEPKKFATEKMLDFIKNNLSDENLKQIMKKSIDELSDLLPTEKLIELELKILEEGEEKHIGELRKNCFQKLEEYKSNRIKPLSHRFAILTVANNKLYDFIEANYITLDEYYINYLTPFNDIFLAPDWSFINDNEGNIILTLSEQTRDLMNLYIKENQNIIDENAYQKIFK